MSRARRDAPLNIIFRMGYTLRELMSVLQEQLSCESLGCSQLYALRRRLSKSLIGRHQSP
jgi:hypothetical protein